MRRLVTGTSHYSDIQQETGCRRPRENNTQVDTPPTRHVTVKTRSRSQMAVSFQKAAGGRGEEGLGVGGAVLVEREGDRDRQRK